MRISDYYYSRDGQNTTTMSSNDKTTLKNRIQPNVWLRDSKISLVIIVVFTRLKTRLKVYV